MLLAYDFGPIAIATIGALPILTSPLITIYMQRKTHRANTRDHGHVVEQLKQVVMEIGGVKVEVRDVKADVRDVKLDLSDVKSDVRGVKDDVAMLQKTIPTTSITELSGQIELVDHRDSIQA